VAYTLEETYELVDNVRERAKQGGDAAVLSELGDLLFQVYFMACVAEEDGLYDLGEVAARHPSQAGTAPPPYLRRCLR